MGKIIAKNLLIYIKKVLLVWIGLCFVILGFIGFVFPVLPGIVFVILGLLLIAKASETFREHHYVKRLFLHIKNRLSKQKGMISRLASLF